MKNEDRLNYQQTIANTYDERSVNHDKSTWHRETALRLVEELPINNGDCVLDVGTGTGALAFYAAELVGSTGRVFGIDLSEGMLAQANEKLAASDLNNLEFLLADAENLEFESGFFDRIYCASAFFWMLDPLAALKHWRDLLKIDGGLGFHALPDTSYVWVHEVRRILANYGINYALNAATANIETCEQLIKDAGFVRHRICEEKLGQFITPEQAKKAWLKKEDFSPGQHPNPLIELDPAIVKQAQQDYEARIDALTTDEGVWNDLSMFYIYAEK